jgi:hypothetical protein
LPIRIVQLGSPRLPDEGVRIGTVRRPPRQLVRHLVPGAFSHAATDGAGEIKPIGIRMERICPPVPEANGRTGLKAHAGPSVSPIRERKFLAWLLL